LKKAFQSGVRPAVWRAPSAAVNASASSRPLRRVGRKALCDESAVLVEGVLRKGGEDSVRPELEKDACAFGMEGTDAIEEADGVADVADPVVGRGELVVGGAYAGEVGDDGDASRMEGEALATRRKSSSMPSMCGEWKAWLTRRREVFRPRASTCRAISQHSVFIASDDGGERPLRAARPSASFGGLEKVADFLFGGLEGDHGAAWWERLHELCARGDEGAGVLERKDAGDVGGDELANGVSEEESGL
jgi:hypothetical protein